MFIDSVYIGVGDLFRDNALYRIPRYQRSYAWESDQIDDFINDLKRCYNSLKAGTSVTHFFGGMISVSKKVEGTTNRYEWEIIDGQQRVATYVLFAVSIRRLYKELESSIDDASLKEIVIERMERISKDFIVTKIEKNRRIYSYRVLELSESDKDYFQELIDDETPVQSRESHKRIAYAFEHIFSALSTLVSDGDVISKIDNLEVVEEVLSKSFAIIHMTSDNRDDVYKLFQVLNDRGMSLTEGDLLRASTLESLSEFHGQLERTAKYWDEILKGKPEEIRKGLSWVYESKQGKTIKNGTLFDSILKKMFPECLDVLEESERAVQLSEKVQKLQIEMSYCARLKNAEWIYERKPPLMAWDYNQFELLILTLGHDLVIPLLMSARHLSAEDFAEIVRIALYAYYRYKVICKGHATPLKRIYLEEAAEIRKNPSSYDLKRFKRSIRDLLEARANDEVFKSNLQLLEYNEKGSNKDLKFLLLMVEYYWEWYNSEQEGEPTCLDRTSVYDFSGLTIEHIYARNIAPQNRVEELEIKKNSLGNLTLLDPNQNSTAENAPFEGKKEIYAQSRISVTRSLAEYEVWDIEKHNMLRDSIIKAAMRIFCIPLQVPQGDTEA